MLKPPYKFNNKVFFFLTAVFIGTSLRYFSFVPLYDGAAFMFSYMQHVLDGKFWCHYHSAFWHVLLFSATQWIDFGNYKLVYLLNLALGIIGLGTFYLFQGHLFGEKVSRTERALMTFFWGLNPVFLAHVIQPSLDYTLPIYLTIVVYALLRQRFVWAALAGSMMVFTKETGIMLYAVPVFFYILFFPFPSKNLRIWKAVGSLIALLLPIGLFGIYMFFNPPHGSMGGSWSQTIAKMANDSFLGSIARQQLADIFLINFNWIITLIIVIEACQRLLHFRSDAMDGTAVAPKKGLFLNPKERIFLWVVFAVIVLFFTRIQFFNNPRYILPAIPLLIVLSAEAIFNIFANRKLRTVILSIILALIYLSSFRTFDPVSKKFFGTFKFGSHEMLFMAKDNDRLEGISYYGRDQIVYNYEFTKISDLTYKIFNELGREELFSMSKLAHSWIPNAFSQEADYGGVPLSYAHMAKRLGSPDKISAVRIMTPKDILKTEIQRFYFIEYPNFNNENEMKVLSNNYFVQDRFIIEDEGYALPISLFVRGRAPNRTE